MIDGVKRIKALAQKVIRSNDSNHLPASMHDTRVQLYQSDAWIKMYSALYKLSAYSGVMLD